jgi:DNA replication and repair protein RecF
MYLSRLVLEEFRLYQRLDLAIPAAGLRIYGANASGKSSLLEAAFMLSTTRSPRASVERELVRFGSGQEYSLPPYARLLGTVQAAHGATHLELALAAETTETGASGEAGLTRKRIKVDGNPRRAHDMVGLLKVVLFTPEDLDLVTGGPSGRRRYLDVTLSQLDPVYLRSLSRYNRVLLQRNALLKQIQEAGSRMTPRQAAEELAYWNEEMVRLGAAVVSRRHDLIRRLEALARARYVQLTERDEALHVGYAASVELAALAAHGERLSLAERETVVARDFAAQLERAFREEVRRGVTTVGPHRDDVTLVLGRVPVGAYGSRGQQRLTVLALKLAEVDLMREVTGEWPVLLLDDLASELDPAHRRFVLETAPAEGKQVLVTATDRSVLDLPSLAGLPWLRAEYGAVHLDDAPS